MVQKDQPKRRGRPRRYDADEALARALDTFWNAGFAATSVDDLSAATGMNRPSLYGAFGDKQALYLQALERYMVASRAAVKGALAPDLPLREALGRVYALAIASYVQGRSGPRGCFLIGTAATEAVGNPVVRARLAAGLRDLDQAFQARIAYAREHGELPRDIDPNALGRLAAAVLHTLAIRARAGETRAALEATAEAGVDLICGRAPRRRK